MNLILIFSLVFLTAKKTNSKKCDINQDDENYFATFPNKIFEEISISTVEDLIWNVTQLDIIMRPTEEFHNDNVSITLSSNVEFCEHFSEYNFNLTEELVTIPKTEHVGTRLEYGCNYTIAFAVENYCIYSFYKIPEQKPCQNFLPEDIFDYFPNKIIENVTVNAFRKNAVRLNISFTPKPEFINHTGYIIINSKMNRCNHPEEFSFKLDETNLTVPRAQFPHSFIDSGCEYMIDFEIDQYCVTTVYKVPNFCYGRETQVEILDIKEENSGIFKVLWDTVKERNKTFSIINISYRLDDVGYEIFNEQMVIENQYQLNYSLLNFSKLSKGGQYRLTAVFLDSNECSNVFSVDFKVPADKLLILKLFVIPTVIFIIISLICFYAPSARSRLITTLKLVFGFAVQTPPTQIISETKYIGINKREEINLAYIGLKGCDEFEFPRFGLEIQPDKDPRGGNFGVVYIGRALGINKNKGYTTVAVKTVRENAPSEEIEALVEEIKTLKKISSHGNNENVVKMLGCCTIQKPQMIILEFVACGDLKNYLIDLREEWSNRKNSNHFVFTDNGSNGVYISPTTCRTVSETSSTCIPSPTETESTIIYDDSDESLLNTTIATPTITKVTPALSNIELQNFALQIAKGMAFLESINIVHRDLAARNVLINEMKILKISDFGMSRTGDYVHRNNGQQPLRWMAIESIEKFVCTNKSDVWSFGVVLWEIGTLGAFPYDSVPNDRILEYLLGSFKKGIRLMRPEICTDELYSLMLKCWMENPDERPSFEQIVGHLSGDKKKIYLDFRKLNPAYVFPPTNHIVNC